MSFDLSNIKLPNFNELSSVINPPKINITDYKTRRIVSAIDNIKNVNRLRDMDNLSYQIELKKKQSNIYKKRLKGINSTLDINFGIIISIMIILISVIIPFMIVAFQEYLQEYQEHIFKYLIVTFIISMISMLGYLIWFWKK